MWKPIAVAVLLALPAVGAMAQTATPPGPPGTAQARPGRAPDQTSVPNAAPPAGTGQTTGSNSQGPVVKQMNDAERAKVEQQGK
jgi:hypothetical protein